LKFGQAVAEDQDTLVVTVVLLLLADMEVDMPLELLILIPTVSIRYVQEAVGLVINLIHVLQEWDVVHT
tara:strand:- start:319 stop:525 length:207 start_codon:yes stop_codon:yes gene_type:complete